MPYVLKRINHEPDRRLARVPGPIETIERCACMNTGLCPKALPHSGSFFASRSPSAQGCKLRLCKLIKSVMDLLKTVMR